MIPRRGTKQKQQRAPSPKPIDKHPLGNFAKATYGIRDEVFILFILFICVHPVHLRLNSTHFLSSNERRSSLAVPQTQKLRQIRSFFNLL